MARSRKLTIRPYEQKDIPYMVQRASEFIPQMPHYRGITFSKARTEYLLQNNVSQKQSWFGGWVLTDAEDIPRGFGGGTISAMIMSTDLMARDVLLAVEEEWRSLMNADLLIKTYIDWARKKNAKLIIASETSGMVGTEVSRETYDRFLSRHGFENVGSVYYLKQ